MNVDGGFQLQDLRGILRRRAKVMGATALVLVLASYWLAMALPNVYTSYATVLVEPQAVDPELVKAGVAESDLNQRLHLMTARILSRSRLSSIIDQYDLYEEESETMLRDEVIDLMRSHVKVEPVIPELQQGQSRRGAALEVSEFKIFYENHDAVLARDVAQQLADDFIDTHIRQRIETSEDSLEFIQSELSRLAEEIEVVESEIAEVKGENPSKLPEDMATNQRRLERLVSEISRVRKDYAEALSEEDFYRTQVASARSIGGGDDASPARRLEGLKLELANYESRGFTPKHPDMIRVKDEIAQLEALLRGGAAEEAPVFDPVVQQLEAAARRSAVRRAAAEDELARLESQAAMVQGWLEATPEVEEKLDGLERRYEHLFNTYQDFSRRHNEAIVQAQLERRQLGEQFRVLERAFKAFEPSAPNRPLILLLGIVFALAAAAGVGVLLEATDTSPHDARQLQTRMQLPVLAQIPQIWLESDRVRQRRSRIRTALATTALVTFALVGGCGQLLLGERHARSPRGFPGRVRCDPRCGRRRGRRGLGRVPRVLRADPAALRDDPGPLLPLPG